MSNIILDLMKNELFRFSFCLLVLIIGNVVIRKVYSFLRNKYVIKNAKNIPYQRAAALLGYLESSAYTGAYYLGHYEFIAVWLGVKAIGRWSSNGPESVVDLIEEIEGNKIEIREKKMRKLTSI